MSRFANAAVVGLLALASGSAACVSLRRTPEARFFVLRSVVDPVPAPDGGVKGGLIGVLPVLVPGYLDRPQLVTWTAPDELRIDEFLRWAEPLDMGINRTLAENLDALLAEHRVIRSPWPGSARPRFRVRVSLKRFGLQQGGDVSLEGRWAILGGQGEGPLLVREASLRHGSASAGAASRDLGIGVEAMSQLLAELSRQIADGIRSLPVPADPDVR